MEEMEIPSMAASNLTNWEIVLADDISSGLISAKYGTLLVINMQEVKDRPWKNKIIVSMKSDVSGVIKHKAIMETNKTDKFKITEILVVKNFVNK